MYRVNIATSKNFTTTLNKLVENYGEDFEKLNGLHESQMNYGDFMDSFTKDNLTEVTIDPNANASNKDICSLNIEKGKPHDKLRSFNKIFHELQKKYGIKVARRWLESEWSGAFYLSNSSSSSLMPYCFSYSLDRLADEGLFFLNNDYNNEPPQHLDTFNSDVIEFISFTSNRSSGAVGLGDYLFWNFYFWKKDKDAGKFWSRDPKSGTFIETSERARRQAFQEFIYRLNQPFLRVDQSAFTNISIYDKLYLKELFGSKLLHDGTLVEDCLDDLMEHQKVFMEEIAITREHNMFTFPVISYSLLYQDNKFQDEETVKWACGHNMKWFDGNFLVSPDITMTSQCPLDKETKIFYYSNRYKQYRTAKIGELYYKLNEKGNTEITTLSNGQEVKCRINQFDLPTEYRITLSNNAVIETTANHLNKVYGKDYVESKYLTTNDYLPYGRKSLQLTDNLKYEDGKLVGMFLGDGSYQNNNALVFSLNRKKKMELIDFLKDYCPKNFGAEVSERDIISTISGKSSCTQVSVKSSYLRGLISQFVNGENALNKEISGLAFTQSTDFREGILDGLYGTDGGNNNRIYTSSEKLRDSLISMLSTLGMTANVTEDNREGRLGTNPCYTVRFYKKDTTKKTYKDIYIMEEDFMWIKIKSIEKIHKNNKSYCLEVLDDVEPVFTLANGIITHNCRIVNSTKKLKGFMSSIGGSSLNVGSIQVNTINLQRIALESGGNEEEFISILKERVLLCQQTLDVIRGIIKRNIEKGILNNYKEGLIDMAKQFSTIGIMGVYEVIEYFGYINEDEFGYKSYSDKGILFASKILDKINEFKEEFKCDYTFNVEAVPKFYWGLVA